MHELLLRSYDGNLVYYKTNLIRNKDKPTLVFIHGLSGNHTVWKPMVEYFSSKGYPIIAFDLFGHGHSKKKDKLKRYSIENHSKDINHVVKREKLNNLVIIGHSMGGTIAFDYALKYKEVKGIVSLSTPPGNPLKYRKIPLHYLKPLFYVFTLSLGWLSSKIHRKDYPHIDYTKLKNKSGTYVAFMDLVGTPLSGYMWSFYNLLKYDLVKDLHKIKCNVLLITGKKDQVIDPKASIIMNKELSNGDLHIMDAFDHLNPIRRPEILIKLIEKFLKKIN